MKPSDQAGIVWLFLILFGIAIYFSYEYFVYTELPENLNATYCKCDAPEAKQAGRVVNGTLTSDSSYPWTAALFFQNETHNGVFCTGAGESKNQRDNRNCRSKSY